MCYPTFCADPAHLNSPASDANLNRPAAEPAPATDESSTGEELRCRLLQMIVRNEALRKAKPR